MKIIQNTAWALITARGGSKSIPLKNIHPVGGRPLLGYSLTALARSRTVSRVLVSTDHEAIADFARGYGADILERPEHLRGDLVASVDVVTDAARTLANGEGPGGDGVAEVLVLIQPTSLFLTSDHLDEAVSALLSDPEAGSAQTVVPAPHQFHAHNQRRMAEDGRDIWFEFPEERERGHNKQTKPAFYCYGNLILTRAQALLEGRGLFARPSLPVVIPLEYAYDLDGFEDIPMAEIMLERGLVTLDEPLEKPLEK